MNDYNWSLTDCGYLAHHGVLGMKWGVRRYQNSDGSLTALGKKRYRASEIEAEEAAATKGDKALYYKTGIKTQKLRDSDNRIKYANRKVSDAKIQEKLSNEKKKSKYRQKLEEKYKSQGMSDEQAAIEAYKSDRTRKILMAAAGTAIAVGVAYGAYKYYDGYVDKYIKSGTTLQRITTNLNTYDYFGRGYAQQQAYFAVGKADKARYEGLYGAQLMNRGKEVFKRSTDVTEGFKVASDHSGLKALREVAKNDSSYMGELKAQLGYLKDAGSTPAQKKVLQNAYRDINSGKITKDVYKAINFGLVDHTKEGQNVANKLYTQLAKNGYRAVQDVNDRLLSGFNSDNPIIAFDLLGKYNDTTYNHKLSVSDIKTADAARRTYDTYKNFALKDLPKIGVGASGVATAVGASKAASNALRRTNDRNIINDYKKEHPDTKLSNEEILDNYYNY